MHSANDPKDASINYSNPLYILAVYALGFPALLFMLVLGSVEEFGVMKNH